MSEWLVGKHAVSAALLGGARTVHEVWLRRGARVEELGDIRVRAGERGVPVTEAPAERMPRAAGRAGAVAASCGPFAYRDESQLPAASGPGALIVVLDRIQDPQNLGAIIRTAEAAGADALCIARRHAAQVTPAVVRASAGASELLPIHRVANVARALELLADLGYWSVGLSPQGPRPWYAVDYRGPIALVVGAEGQGLRRLVAERCDHLVSLPMSGRVQSLNAGAALAAAVYEVIRQRRQGAVPSADGAEPG